MTDAEGALGLTLWSTDVFAMATFLEKVAGMVIEQRHPGFARLSTGGATITIHDDESYRGHPWYEAIAREGVARGIGTEVRLKVGDVHDAFAQARNLRAQTVAAPFELEGLLECQVMGPDGYVFSLWQVWNSPTST